MLPVLPGEAPAAGDIWLVPELLVGAGEGLIVPPPEALMGELLGELIGELILLMLEAGVLAVVLPGEVMGETVLGEEVAELSGAGAIVWANATPTEHKTATVAKGMHRIWNSCLMNAWVITE